MKIPYFVVNAFAQGPFSGNPAGVCPLDQWPSPQKMLFIARQNNLSETAFVGLSRGRWRIRWFSPAAEVDLCGHATLAAAHVLKATGRWKKGALALDSRSGVVTVEKGPQGRLGLDFPRWALKRSEISLPWARALGRVPREVWQGEDLVAVYGSEREIQKLTPSLEILKKFPGRGVVVTALGKKSDYVLRFFGPRLGIAEDPATGSAQCALAPFWAERLGKDNLYARQLSSQRGEMWCRVSPDRVKIGGRTTLVMRGQLYV